MQEPLLLARLPGIKRGSDRTALQYDRPEGTLPLGLRDQWVWDFWFADDGRQYHIFFLHAPKSLGDPELRHRNARIGHATSPDLKTWQSRGEAIGPGEEGAFDATATWTGSVVRGPDGLWWMFYTGARFLSADSPANIESVGLATSLDLMVWTKVHGPVLRANSTWYETLGSSSWPEEAWRDPWVFADPGTAGWHMLITARANHGPNFARGVVGHAISADLRTWQARPPLSEPQSGFAHLEVLQPIEIDGRHLVIFSCNSARLANDRDGKIGGIWAAPSAGPVGPYDIAAAQLLLPEQYYAGRAVRDRSGAWMLMGFEMSAADGSISGVISDPMPLRIDAAGRLSVTKLQPAARAEAING